MADEATARGNLQITKAGPYVVTGGAPLARQHVVTNAEGESLDWRDGDVFPQQETYALCRCGESGTKPFCDGSHTDAGFDGTETAGHEPYAEQATVFDGPSMAVTDQRSLCALARFCDPKGDIWSVVEVAEDDESREIVRHEAACCPSGRLVAWDKATGKALEPKLEPSTGIIDDTALKVSGPIWVRGGIPIIGADGVPYEVRNRVTLCRCGASQNKPFCDGAHARIQFRDDV